MSPRVSLALAAAAAATALAAGPAAAQAPVDTFPPAITITVPTEGQVLASDQGNVPTNFACQDELGGSGVATCTGDATIDTTQVGDRTFTVQTTDHAGNATQKTVNYRVVDMIPPQITITAPTAGEHVKLHSTVDATFACTDQGGSLIDECEGDQNVDTSALGTHMFTVLATDGDGNRTTMSVPYVVDPIPTFDPDLDHNTQAVLNAAVPALRKLAHAASATIASSVRPGSAVAVKVTGRRRATVAKGSGRSGADGSVRFALRLKSRKLLRGRLNVAVTVTNGRVARRSRGVTLHR